MYHTTGFTQPLFTALVAELTTLGEKQPQHTGRRAKPSIKEEIHEDLDPTQQLIIDGTIIPCWDWDAVDKLYSFKHHTTGFNIQVACDLYGRLAWVSDPLPGTTHDALAIDISGLLDDAPDLFHIGDKGYVGKGMITPEKKLPGYRAD